MNNYNADESLPLLMMDCVKCMRESLNTTFSSAGYKISHEQWTVLVHLGQEDGISQQDLADRSGRSKVSIMNLLKKLEKGGFIVRENNPLDGRYNCVFLTDTGRDLQNALIPLAKQNILRMTQGMTGAEVYGMKKRVRQIKNNINALSMADVENR